MVGFGSKLPVGEEYSCFLEKLIQEDCIICIFIRVPSVSQVFINIPGLLPTLAPHWKADTVIGREGCWNWKVPGSINPGEILVITRHSSNMEQRRKIWNKNCPQLRKGMYHGWALRYPEWWLSREHTGVTRGCGFLSSLEESSVCLEIQFKNVEMRTKVVLKTDCL